MSDIRFICITGMQLVCIKEVCNCSGHHSVHLFIIEISSSSHVKPKQPQIIFLQYSCSATMINIVKNICEENS